MADCLVPRILLIQTFIFSLATFVNDMKCSVIYATILEKFSELVKWYGIISSIELNLTALKSFKKFIRLKSLLNKFRI